MDMKIKKDVHNVEYIQVKTNYGVLFYYFRSIVAMKEKRFLAHGSHSKFRNSLR